MLVLLLLQSVLLVTLIAIVAVWRIQTADRIHAIQQANLRNLDAEQRLQGVLMNLQVELNELRAGQTAPPPPAPLAVLEPAPSLTIAKRSQAIKMIRRGEPAEAVSAALGVPRSHIQLLIKVQELIQAGS